MSDAENSGGPSETYLAKIKREQDIIDRMPPEWRALVAEYSFAQVAGLIDQSYTPEQAASILARLREQKQL